MLVPEILAGLILVVVLVALFRIDSGILRLAEGLERVAKALETGPASAAARGQAAAPAAPRPSEAGRRAEIAAAIAAARLAAQAQAVAAQPRPAAQAEARALPSTSGIPAAAAYDGRSGGLVDVFGELERSARAGERPGAGSPAGEGPCGAERGER